jgi:hypothetical protein
MGLLPNGSIRRQVPSRRRADLTACETSTDSRQARVSPGQTRPTRSARLTLSWMVSLSCGEGDAFRGNPPPYAV